MDPSLKSWCRGKLRRIAKSRMCGPEVSFLFVRSLSAKFGIFSKMFLDGKHRLSGKS